LSAREFRRFCNLCEEFTVPAASGVAPPTGEQRELVFARAHHGGVVFSARGPQAHRRVARKHSFADDGQCASLKSLKASGRVEHAPAQTACKRLRFSPRLTQFRRAGAATRPLRFGNRSVHRVGVGLGCSQGLRFGAWARGVVPVTDDLLGRHGRHQSTRHEIESAGAQTGGRRRAPRRFRLPKKWSSTSSPLTMAAIAARAPTVRFVLSGQFVASGATSGRSENSARPVGRQGRRWRAAPGSRTSSPRPCITPPRPAVRALDHVEELGTDWPAFVRERRPLLEQGSEAGARHARSSGRCRPATRFGRPRSCATKGTG